MCVVSFIGDNFRKRTEIDDYWKKILTPLTPASNPYNEKFEVNLNFATKQELDALRREVEQLKELLKEAIEYDKRNNEPHCEIDEKVAMIKKIAEAFGVDLTEIFKK